MAKKKAPRLTFNVIKSFADPNTSDEKIKEILFDDADNGRFSLNASKLFIPFLAHEDICLDNPKELIEAVEIYAKAVERALAVCGGDLLYSFRMFGNDNSGQINSLLSSQSPVCSHPLNSVGSGLLIQNDIVCQYVLVNQDMYPHFASELCKYDNEVIDAMMNKWTRPYNQTKEYTEGDIVITPLPPHETESPFKTYPCDGSPVFFRAHTTKNDTDHIEIGVYTTQSSSQYLCEFKPRYCSNHGTDTEIYDQGIIIDVVGCSEEQSKDFAKFATKAVAAILNMIKGNLITIDDSGYLYYGVEIDEYGWSESDAPYIDPIFIGGKRVVEILMSDEIPSDDYKFFDNVFTKNGFKDSGFTPYIGYDEENEKTVYNMHRYYQVIDIKSLFPDEAVEVEE